MMIGDLILYRSTGRWYERLITFATRGSFVHVAIVIDANTVIASRSSGIRYEPLPPLDSMHVTISVASCTTSEGIVEGLAWAVKQLGDGYGWLDILYQGVKFLAPNNPFRFGIAGHYDCSDFACRYLIHAGVQLPDAMLDTYTDTPNDLARWAGLLPPRKG